MKSIIVIVIVLISTSRLLVSGCIKYPVKEEKSPSSTTTSIPAIINPDIIYTREGSSLEISCKDNKTISVTSIQLLKIGATAETLFNSRIALLDKSQEFSVQNRSIRDFTVIFKSVAKHNAGFYQCSVKGQNGTATKNYSIVITDKTPSCKKSNFDRKNNSEVQLDCSISYQGKTHPTLQWRKDNDMLCNQSVSLSSESSLASVIVAELDECKKESVTYTCEFALNNSAQEVISCNVNVSCKTTQSTVSGQIANPSPGSGSNILTTVLCVICGIVLLTLCAIILCVKYGKCRKWKRETDTVQMSHPAEAICYENVERKHNLPDVARTNDNSAIEQLYAQVDHQAKTKNQNNVDQSAAVYEDPVILKPKTNTTQKNKKGGTRPPPRTNVGPVDGTVYAVLDNNAKPNRIGSAVKPPVASGNQLPPAEPAVYAPVVHLKR